MVILSPKKGVVPEANENKPPRYSFSLFVDGMVFAALKIENAFQGFLAPQLPGDTVRIQDEIAHKVPMHRDQIGDGKHKTLLFPKSAFTR